MTTCEPRRKGRSWFARRGAAKADRQHLQQHAAKADHVVADLERWCRKGRSPVTPGVGAAKAGHQHPHEWHIRCDHSPRSKGRSRIGEPCRKGRSWSRGVAQQGQNTRRLFDTQQRQIVPTHEILAQQRQIAIHLRRGAAKAGHRASAHAAKAGRVRKRAGAAKAGNQTDDANHAAKAGHGREAWRSKGRSPTPL